jgi:fibronectin type 3 domain-containing protein
MKTLAFGEGSMKKAIMGTEVPLEKCPFRAFSCRALCVRLLTLVICYNALYACGKKSDPFVLQAIAPKSVKDFQALSRPEGTILFWRPPRENIDKTPLYDLAGFKIFREEILFEKSCPTCPKNFYLLHDYAYSGIRGKVPVKEFFVYYDRSLTFKNVYTYKIHCYNEHGNLSPASSFVTIDWDTPPAPPRALQHIQGQRAVELLWSGPDTLEDGTPMDEFTGFNMYRTVEKGIYDIKPINSEPIMENTFLDTSVGYDNTYYYTVRTLLKVGASLIESYPSEEITVAYLDTTPPGIPQGLTAIAVPDGVLLKWIPKTEKDFAGFHLYRKEPDQQQFVRINDKLITGASWVDRTTKMNNVYIYGITGIDNSLKKNESSLSETVKILYILR